jgi:hypothetical protein
MSHSVSESILQFIRLTPLAQFDDAAFNELALRLFEHQFDKNAVYRGICEQQWAIPNRVTHWQQLPAVTTSAFKEVAVTCFSPYQAMAVFHTSGTTQKRAGKHYFRTLEFYRTAMLRSFVAYCFSDRISDSEFWTPNDLDARDAAKSIMRMFFLGPTLEHFPHSSLGYMLSGIKGELGDKGSAVFFSPRGVDTESLLFALDKASEENLPVFILGTALALLECVETFQRHEVKFKLPPGSRILDTGGYKGRRREISRDEFQSMLVETFGVPQEYLLNEYGMTELSSQSYESHLPKVPLHDERPNVKFVPPWVRVVAVNPEDLKILPEGEPGLLRIFDLANVDSVMAIQSEDLGRAWRDRIELLGRATGAELRGCSLLTESIVRAA